MFGGVYAAIGDLDCAQDCYVLHFSVIRAPLHGTMKDQHGMVVLQDALMQTAAFQDVCYLAEAKGQEAWRRKMVFAQETGEAWQQIGTACMDEVRLL